MAYVTRKATNAILEAIEQGLLDPMAVVRAALCYMSEADVADMAHANELIPADDDDDDDDDDTDTDTDTESVRDLCDPAYTPKKPAK